MKRPKNCGAVAGLPDDPLVEILSRVPVKDLRRSKCVSKGWRDLIADPLHRRKLPQTLEGFFHHEDFIGLFGGSPPPVDPSFPFLRKLPGIGRIWLRGSCNGLLLFRHAPNRTIRYIVCNPATEQWAAVPSEHTPADKHDGVSRTYLVFDPAVSSHFQLVTICAEEGSLATLHTYSSKTGVWMHRQINWTEEEKKLGHWRGVSPQIRATVCGSAFFNGMLYVMLRDANVAVVDVEGKIQGIIPAPSSGGRPSAGRPLFIGQSQGRLCCIFERLWTDDFPSELSVGVYTRDFDDDRYLLTFWVLEDYDTQKWVLKHSVRRMCLFGRRSYEASRYYGVVGIHPDSNLVFIFLYGKRQLISFGLDSNEVRVLVTLEQYPLWFTPYVPCFLDFLSVPQHDEKLKGQHEPSRKDVIGTGECSGQ